MLPVQVSLFHISDIVCLYFLCANLRSLAVVLQLLSRVLHGMMDCFKIEESAMRGKSSRKFTLLVSPYPQTGASPILNVF